ncbi:pentapeptide repeat-containing protein [Streptomyces sp. NPDC058301]|uniref:pentapeptide repeat-containing protein n=1 Tax=Streptomyces sp. NPDC058301 TaxID=3346436 RepID=UPI0036EB4ECD
MADARWWNRRKLTQSGRHAPNLLSVWFVAPVTLIAASGAFAVIYWVISRAVSHGHNSVSVPDRIKITIAILTLTGFVLAGVYAYRKQRIAEGDTYRADATHLADRYTTAASQLGHDTPAVRLAGVYAMARLADEWEEQRQVCIDVLCAYLRMPYETDPESAKYKEGEREVRHTIIRVIRSHLQQPKARTSWSACMFDFTGATFDGGHLMGSHFLGGVSFALAKFCGGSVTLSEARFSGPAVTFAGAEFSDGTVSFSGSQFSHVFFLGAKFCGGTVLFRDAKVCGLTVFDNAEFSGGTVSFDNVEFSGTNVQWGPIQPPEDWPT